MFDRYARLAFDVAALQGMIDQKTEPKNPKKTISTKEYDKRQKANKRAQKARRKNRRKK